MIARVHVGRADDAPGFRVLVPEVRFHHFLSVCERARVCFNEGKFLLFRCFKKVVTFLDITKSSRVDTFDYSMVFGICFDEFITTCMCIVLELQMSS